MNYKYAEIMDYLRGEIEKNIFTDKLPSIRGLAIKFDCSNSTVIKAYNELESLGLVFAAPKSGYYINKKKVVGAQEYDFYSGVPASSLLPYDSLEKAYVQTLKEGNRSLMNYSYPMGYNLLREYLLKELPVPGIPLESLFITSGTQGAVSLLLSTLKPTESLLVEDPTYNILLAHLSIQGQRFVTVPRNHAGLDLGALEARVASGGVRYFYTIPRNHNPLGTDLGKDTMEAVLDLARRYDFHVVEDDYTGDILKGPTFFSLDPGRTILLRSFSKTLSPALRIGFMVVPEALSKDYAYNAMYLNLGPSQLSQAVLLRYLKSDSHARDMALLRDRMRQNLMILRNALGGFPFEFHVADTGYYSSLLFPKDFKLKTLLETMQAKGYRFRDGTGFTQQEDLKLVRISTSRVEPDAVNTAVKELVREVLTMRGERDDKNKIYI